MSNASESSGGAILALVLFPLGIYLFFRGFSIYRRYRLLADTPRATARSASMGLVEIEGVTKRAEKFVDSPVSSIPCLYYKVEIEAEKIDKEGRSTWSALAKDMAGVPFYLEDTSGQILVDPTGAELDLEVIAERSTSAKARGKSDGYAYSKLETDTHAPPPVSDEVLNGYAGAFLARKRRLAPGLGPLRDVLEWILFKIGTVSRYSHAYRFKEYCLRPGFTHVIVGTCEENPNPRDANDRNMIVKGKNNPTFIISQGTEKRRERGLRFMSGCAVFGGAILTLYALAYLLYALGLFSGRAGR